MIAATNRPDIIDSAVLRPGRLGLHLYVPVPTVSDRKDILYTVTRKLPLDDDVDLDKVAADPKLDDFTGADLSHLCENAAKLAAWDDSRTAHKILQRDFEEALTRTHTSVSKEDMVYYKQLTGKFK
jgi:SpoVK/Ycf46/Vps4 family AAA+-type ATPase